MRTIIAGSRSITDPGIIRAAIRKSKLVITEIVCGCAAGVDRLGENYGNLNNIPVAQYPAEWDKYGKSAGYRRNVVMAENADALIAIWDGKSSGTKHMIDIAKSKGLCVKVWIYE